MKLANIPETVTDNLIEKIGKNEKLLEEMMKLEKEINKNKDDAKIDLFDRKNSATVDKDTWSRTKQSEEKVAFLRGQLVSIRLNQNYMPNTLQHLNRWGYKIHNLKEGKSRLNNLWKAEIEEKHVKTIMLMNVPLPWKTLLLMGIGMFIEEEENEDVKAYMEIVKELAEEQKLFMIIASSDYIYGMNYQFCHGHIGEFQE